MNKQYIDSLKQNRNSHIFCTTKEQKFTVAQILKEAGEIVGTSFKTVVSIDMSYPAVRWGGGQWDGSSAKFNADSVSFEQFVAGVFSPEAVVHIIKLNGEHTAVYVEGETTVKVGCQTIEVSVIKELAKVLK